MAFSFPVVWPIVTGKGTRKWNCPCAKNVPPLAARVFSTHPLVWKSQSKPGLQETCLWSLINHNHPYKRRRSSWDPAIAGAHEDLQLLLSKTHCYASCRCEKHCNSQKNVKTKARPRRVELLPWYVALQWTVTVFVLIKWWWLLSLIWLISFLEGHGSSHGGGVWSTALLSEYFMPVWFSSKSALLLCVRHFMLCIFSRQRLFLF